MELEHESDADEIYDQLTEQQEALVTDSHKYEVAGAPVEKNRYNVSNGPNYVRTIAELEGEKSDPDVRDVHERLEEDQGLNYDRGMIRTHLTDLQRADVVELTLDDEVSLTEEGRKLL